MLRPEYQIVHAYEPKVLAHMVTSFLYSGWDLWGNPFAVSKGQDTEFYQAIVRTVESKPQSQEVLGFSLQVPETPAVREG